MLKDNIYLNDGITPRQYVLIGQTGQDSVRVRTDSLPGLPCRLAIKHSSNGGKGNEVDRHLVQITRAKKDGAGVARTLTVNTTVTVPRDGFTAAEINEVIGEMLSFFRSLPSTQDASASVSVSPAKQEMTDALIRGES